MNRFKKELRKKGVKLECDYPYLPFDVKSVSIESVVAKAELAIVVEYTNVGTMLTMYDRSLNIIEQIFM